MSENRDDDKKDSRDRKREEQLRQLKQIHDLATRLPWIVLGLSLLAFIIIFLQVLFLR